MGDGQPRSVLGWGVQQGVAIVVDQVDTGRQRQHIDQHRHHNQHQVHAATQPIHGGFGSKRAVDRCQKHDEHQANAAQA